ncbi:MAG: class I SAM-dependent methyltransferase [Burkholderiaceae bacterium]|nr:class I SAM-dependent methyltransferase [Burkholderiaceae bacterium]
MNLASRYNAIPGISLGTKLFLHLRWLMTPYSAMSSYVPKVGRVLDVGCGHGLLAMKLALSAPGRAVLATDHDVQRIEVARQAGAGIDNLQFEVSAGSPVTAGSFDAIMMIDFLHYFSPEEQDSMIRQALVNLHPGGRLLVREVNQQVGLISKLNQLYEKVATLTGFTQSNAIDALNFRSQSGWEAAFTAHGFKVRSERCSSPIFADILYICEKVG